MNDESEVEEVVIQGLVPKQNEILKWFISRQSTVLLVMGARGGGKSALARVLIGVQSQLYPGQDIIYASQSCDNSESQFDQCIKNLFIRSLLRPSSRYGEPFSKQPPTLHFANGCNCIFWSMERSEGKRGRHVPLVIVDEAQSIGSYDFKDVLSPMSDVPGGHGMIIVLGSCPIYGTWYHEYSEIGKKWPNDASIKTFTIMPWESKVFQGPEGQRRLEQKKKQMGEAVFNVEYLLEPRMPGDSYFKNDHVSACIIRDENSPYFNGQSSSSSPTILAYDPAIGTVDPAAMAVMNKEGMVLFSFSWPQDADIKTKLDDLKATANRYNSFVVVDTQGNVSMKDQLLMTLDDLLPNGVAELPLMKHIKPAYYDNFAYDLENKLVQFPGAFTELIKQIRHVCCKKNASNYISIEAPRGEHDDECNAVISCRESIRQGFLDFHSPKGSQQGSPKFGVY